MKICIVHGQNHKGSTYFVCQKILDNIPNKEIKEFFLPKDFNSFCLGCCNCFLKDEKLCKDHEARDVILNAMLWADLLIFTTPTYVYHCSGSMKAFLDHLGFMWVIHRPKKEMFKKKAIVISTAAGGGMSSAIKDIKDSMFYWGVPKVYSLGIASYATKPEQISKKRVKKIESKAQKIACKVVKKHKYTPSIKFKIIFNFMRLIHRKNWNQVDIDYYALYGWDKKERPWK